MLEEEIIANGGAKPLAIVMGRLYTTRLTLVRAAGMVGCDVVLIQTQEKGYYLKTDSSSKYVTACHHCPEPDDKALVELILSYADKGRKVVLLPADDWVASVLDIHYDLLSKCCLLPNVCQKQGGILRLMDKDFQKAIARKIGARVAYGWLCQEEDGEYMIPDGITYPCFTKPQESYPRPLKYLQKRCDNEKELRAVLQRIPQGSHKTLLVEEYVEIEKEYGVQGATFEGRAVAPAVVAKDSSRQGITATGKILPIKNMPELKKQVDAFLKETGMTGIFDIEFFESKGRLYFNEFNVRLGANGFALTYGVSNVPGLYVKYMLGESDGMYVGPTEFEIKSFASEKVLRDFIYDRIMSVKEFKNVVKNSDILCLKNEEDNKPFKEFSKVNLILPLWRWLKELKKKMER